LISRLPMTALLSVRKRSGKYPPVPPESVDSLWARPWRGVSRGRLGRRRGYNEVWKDVRELNPDGRPANFARNYDRSELLVDGLVHAIGVGLGLIGAVALVVYAVNSTHGADAAAYLVYAAGLMSMLVLSAAYNLWPVSRAKWFLRRLDHSAIFVLIAATYTPFLVKAGAGSGSTALLIGVWLVAIGGVLLKLLWPGRLDRLSVVLYLMLGWAGAAAYPVVATLPASTLWLIASGGMLYSAGVLFHLRKGLRFQNAAWHVFVLLAAACHYTAVLGCVS
jgi:hemolysin III